MQEFKCRRRRFVAFAAASAAIGSGAMCGCATGADGLPATLAPKFAWPGPVDFQGFRFLFQSARFADRYNTAVAWVDVGSLVLILDVTVSNTSNEPRAYQHQPTFSIHDLDGAEYGADLQHTIRVNMGRPGRVSAGASMNPNVPSRSEVIFLVSKRTRYFLDVAVPSPYGGFARFFRMDLGSALV